MFRSFVGTWGICCRLLGGNYWLGEEGQERGEEGAPPGVPVTVEGLPYTQDACAGGG